MRAFKQFLSLVLVTCMLTSMFTIVSAVGPTMDGQVWDSDSGHVLIQQGSGTKVDSGYVKYADSNYVKVELDENKTVEVDLTSGKEDVIVTLTGENLAGSFDLKVLDSGDNLVYAPANASPVEANDEVKPGDSDDWKITFEVPPISMAGGSTLAVYPAGSDALAWEISYKTRVKGSLTTGENTPAEIPTVSEEGSNSVTVPAAAVKAVLDKVEAAEAYVSVSAPAEGGSLMLDTSVFDNPKFEEESFALHIQVEGKDGASYTWTFTKSNTRNRALLSESSVDLNVKVNKEATFGKEDSISGTSVEVNSNMIPADMSAKLTVETNLTDSVKAFYQDDSQKWVEDSENANLTVESGKVTFEVSKAASEYAIVASDVTAEQMNKEGGSDQEKPPVEETHDYKVTIDQANATVEVGKTTTLTATVTDKGEKITEGYTIQWKVTPGTGSATVDAKGVVTGGTKGTVTVKATATIGKYTVTSAPITVNVTSKGSTTPPTTGGGGSSSSGGGGSWNDGSHGSSMPSAGSGTTTTPGTGTTTPGTGTSGNAQPQGCVSDTVGNFSVKGSYQYKLTSTNGQAPAVTVSNSNFRVVLASQNGKDYFFKVYAVGAVGQTCDVLVNGTKVSTVTASEVYGGVSCDTTAPFTVKKGGSYQFKLTASSKPVMAAGSSSFRVEYVGNSGNDWFFKVYAVGNAGDGCGFYVNGAPFTVAVAHIGE